ncbi:MAG: FkbM family methyltransferase [Spirulina sp. SIO3F2]|nr:FkbM family methyltransferase [Spirulina sp. SIO3F2]
MLTYFNRPEYLLQPRQIIRRWRRSPHQTLSTPQTLHLPWGYPLRIVPHPDNKVEWSLWIMGIYDLALSEALWRLTDPDEMALDIGANIGYMTSLFAAKVGPRGQVIAFEPNPDIYTELQYNCGSLAAVELRAIALADTAGVATLRVPKHNHGEASLLFGHDPHPEATLKKHQVTVDTLTQQLEAQTQVGVLKIDIEGYELAAFAGAEPLLAQGRIRDILYEQHEGYPSPASTFLEAQGYQVFRLWKGFWRPLLLPADYPQIHPWEPPNYLATRAPERAQKRLRSRGWQVLRKEKGAG